MNYYFEDFTESEYRNLLRTAKRTWEFRRFVDYHLGNGKTCLWRHDVDLSPQRALRLAEIEAEEGVVATYDILLHSSFYNALEHGIREIFQKICRLGHDIGLHFDARFYEQRDFAQRGLADLMAFEKIMIERLFDLNVTSVSFHNYDGSPPWMRSDDDEIAGMINTYGRRVRQNFAYCSDSNGYWRFRRLRDVLEEAEDERLLVLLHAEWWVPEPMSPRDRVIRCIDGRARRTLEHYDAAVKLFGRENVR